MMRLSQRQRSRWFWALSLALLLGQWFGSHAAFAHHAQMLLSSSPMSQVCSTQTGTLITGAITATGSEPAGANAEHSGMGLPPCCAACAVLSAAPPQLPQIALSSAPDDTVQFSAASGPVTHQRLATLPPARAPPARA